MWEINKIAGPIVWLYSQNNRPSSLFIKLSEFIELNTVVVFLKKKPTWQLLY